MKFVVTNSRSSFSFFKREKKGDGEEYSYLQSIYQIKGLRKIYIVLYAGFQQREELMNQLRWYGAPGEIYYELGSVI